MEDTDFQLLINFPRIHFYLYELSVGIDVYNLDVHTVIFSLMMGEIQVGEKLITNKNTAGQLVSSPPPETTLPPSHEDKRINEKVGQYSIIKVLV